MSSRDLVNCIIVGMQGILAMRLLRRLRDETGSSLATVARAAADEMSKVLGPWPKFDVQLLRTVDVVDYNVTISRLLPGHKNLICVGVNAETYDAAGTFIKRLRSEGHHNLAVAIYDGDLSPYADVACRRIVALNHMGFDRVVSNKWDPAEIEALLQSLARNDAMRMEKSVIESYGPLRIVWNSEGSTRHVDRIYSEDDTGEKADIGLTRKQLSLFEKLALTPGVTVSNEGLLNHIYAEHDEPNIRIIGVYVCQIRDKIVEAMCKLGYEKIGIENGPIKTVWGNGFLLNPNFGQNITKVAVRSSDNEAPEIYARVFAP